MGTSLAIYVFAGAFSRSPSGSRSCAIASTRSTGSSAGRWRTRSVGAIVAVCSLESSCWSTALLTCWRRSPAKAIAVAVSTLVVFALFQPVLPGPREVDRRSTGLATTATSPWRVRRAPPRDDIDLAVVKQATFGLRWRPPTVLPRHLDIWLRTERPITDQSRDPCTPLHGALSIAMIGGVHLGVGGDLAGHGRHASWLRRRGVGDPREHGDPVQHDRVLLSVVGRHHRVAPASHTIGRLLMLGGPLYAFLGRDLAAAGTLEPLVEPGVYQFLFWASSLLSWPGVALIFGWIPLLFPTGSLPGPRWRIPVALLVVLSGITLVALGTATRPPADRRDVGSQGALINAISIELLALVVAGRCRPGDAIPTRRSDRAPPDPLVRRGGRAVRYRLRDHGHPVRAAHLEWTALRSARGVCRDPPRCRSPSGSRSRATGCTRSTGSSAAPSAGRSSRASWWRSSPPPCWGSRPSSPASRRVGPSRWRHPRSSHMSCSSRFVAGSRGPLTAALTAPDTTATERPPRLPNACERRSTSMVSRPISPARWTWRSTRGRSAYGCDRHGTPGFVYSVTISRRPRGRMRSIRRNREGRR